MTGQIPGNNSALDNTGKSNMKDIYYVQEEVGGWRQNAIFSGTKEECEKFYDDNPSLWNKSVNIVHETNYEVDYL